MQKPNARVFPTIDSPTLSVATVHLRYKQYDIDAQMYPLARERVSDAEQANEASSAERTNELADEQFSGCLTRRFHTVSALKSVRFSIFFSFYPMSLEQKTVDEQNALCICWFSSYDASFCIVPKHFFSYMKERSH